MPYCIVLFVYPSLFALYLSTLFAFSDVLTARAVEWMNLGCSSSLDCILEAAALLICC